MRKERLTKKARQAPFYFYPWLIWILAAAFYCYGLYLQISPSVMVNGLMHDFSISTTKLSHLSAFYFYSYTIMQIPVGLLIDRFGVRKMITIAAILCAIGCFLFSTTNNYNIAALGRFITGIGTSFAAIGCLNIIAFWFPNKRFAFLAGLTLTIGMLGITFGINFFVLLIEKLKWNDTILLLGFIGILFAALAILILRDKKIQIDDHNIVPYQLNLISNLKYILINKQNWIVAVYGGLMFMSTPVLGALWGVPFIMHKFQLSQQYAATIITALFFGWAIGSPFWGWFSDYICRRKIVLYASSLGALISILIILYSPWHILFFISIMLFSFGFFSGGFLISFAVIREINAGNNNTGALLGFMNTINVTGGALALPFTGWILDVSRETRNAGIHLYAMSDFHIALSVIPLGIFITLLILPFMKETFCQYTLLK